MLNELNNFVYVNHLGQRFEGMANGMYLNHSDILNYSWNYDVLNNRISRFYRTIGNKKLPIVVIGKTDAEAIAAKNRLFEIAEVDVLANLPGKIYVGEYYISGFVTASEKKKYLYHKRHSTIDLTFTSNDPTWYLERTYSFFPTANDTSGGVDYPHDYPHDYALSLNGRKIVVDSIEESAFRLLIYGEATNPTISIGGHNYTVTGTIGNGETLLIDGLSKKITLTSRGKKTNWFDKRGREDYIFEPLPEGISTVTWNGSFGFDLTVIEKRSEPKWI